VATSGTAGLGYEDSIEIFAQAVAALLTSPESRPAGLQLLPGLVREARSTFIRRSVSSSVFKEPVALGWKPWTKAPYTTAGPALWLLQAIALAGGDGTGVTPKEKQSVLEMAQDALAQFHPGPEQGWNHFPLQDNPSAHSTYTTALALQTLLELRSAQLPWQDSDRSRDQFIGSAVQWLVMNFERDRNGWRADPIAVGEVYEGLTLQIYSLLLRSRREISTDIPEEVHRAMYGTARSWEERKDFSQMAPERWPYNRRFINAEGVSSEDENGIAFAKHPWAIAFASEWLGYLRSVAAPNEQITQARRTLANLVLTHGESGIESATEANRETFVASEFLYALGNVKPGILRSPK
jgi:hypothetical protein